MPPAFIFRLATIADAVEIAALVNAGYRGEASRQGWTTEADLLEGLRTTPKQVQAVIQSPHENILLCLKNQRIVGTICLEAAEAIAHIGMFTVSPQLQSQGIGKQLLSYAENHAKQCFNAKTLMMQVINTRHELIAFYERRGYRRTGVLQDFPLNPTMWQLKVDTLKLERLEKHI